MLIEIAGTVSKWLSKNKMIVNWQGNCFCLLQLTTLLPMAAFYFTVNFDKSMHEKKD
jgi:uncharacterized protein YpmS